jgi:putative copper resistance protein D
MDWMNVVVRFALYLDLMLVFGLPLFALHALRGQERSSGIAKRFAGIAAFAALLGIGLSLINLVIMAKAMSGASTYAEIEQHVFGMIIEETSYGAAWLVRLLALAACIVVGISLRNKAVGRFGIMAACGAVALSTLAWGGHGAMDEAMRGYVHLSADIVHLLAVGTWVGALAAFLLMLPATRTATADHIALLSRTLNGFAVTGTIVVASLTITGLINYWMIVGPTLKGLFSSEYGILLVGKLVLFGSMLGMAAANRYRLSPLLEKTAKNGNHAAAVRALRTSLVAETSCSFLILGLVAWLGSTSPVAV